MIEISTKEIEIFLAVAKYRSISEAARNLYTSQSAVSSWISKMEDDCRLRLFDRSRHGVSLTESGAELYSKLDVAYNRFRVSVEDICAEHVCGENTLRLGAVNRLHVMSRQSACVEAMRECRPDMEIIAKDYNFHEVRDKALCGELDVIFTLSNDVELFSEFEYMTMSEYPAYFIMPPGLGDIERLAGKTLLVETIQQKQWALELCERCGIRPSGTEYVNSYITMAMLVSKGECFSIDDKMGTERFFLPDIKYIPVPCGHSAEIVAAWPKHRATEKVESFRSCIRPRLEAGTL